MKKLIDAIKKALGMDKKSSDSSKGFTLIELLVVIAVIGILAAALLIAIDPIDKIKAGNDTKVVNDVRAIYDGANRAYANTSEIPADAAAVVTAGELKSEPQVPNDSYGTYRYITDGTSAVAVYGEVQSKSNRNKAGVTGTAEAYFVASPAGGCYVAAADLPTAGNVATWECP